MLSIYRLYITTSPKSFLDITLLQRDQKIRNRIDLLVLLIYKFSKYKRDTTRLV